MNIKINYGTGVATLPTAALGSLDRATKADIKLLFLLCAEPYLLVGESREACVSRICERAGCPVGQVEAALAFWRGAGVLDMEDEEGSAPASATASASDENCPAAEPSVSSSEDESEAPTEAPASALNVTVTRAKTKMLDEIPNYTADELDKFLSEQKEAANFLNECQDIWGGFFNLHDSTVIISLVDTWGFSWNYVISLLAYANKYFQERENQGKSINYVYRLAMSYYKEGILTDEALQQKFVEQERMVDFEHRIRAIFGLGGRNLTPKEKKYFSTWLYEYKYNIDVVEMAYNITVDTKGSPNISYINGILKNWYEDGLKTVEEITAKREQDSSTIQSIKEGRITPDNARETVESILASESPSTEVPRSDNISQDINILRRLMNLGNRMLTDGEIASFTKWRTEFGFRYEIIYHAYQITLENRREYNLPYMDAILTKWHDRKLTTMEAIRAYDKGFREDKEKAKQKSKLPFNAPTQNSSFDTNEFFLAAVKRSFGDDFDPSVLDQ